MIFKLDVPSFGLFNNYTWDVMISRDESFKRMNIIYGRNYSGKTTLSRIFKCIEDGLMHKDYLGCDFKVTLDNNVAVTPANLQDFSRYNKLRVYNTDFVRENLGWLHREDGTIKPFTILGAVNIELERQIETIIEKLGSVEDEKGLLFEVAHRELQIREYREANNGRDKELENKLRIRANDKIKMDNTLFMPTSAKRIYSIVDIKNDIAEVINNVEGQLLDIESSANFIKLLEESALENVDLLLSNKTRFAEYLRDTELILQQKITPTNPIIELINDSLLQEWVRQGIDKHRGVRTSCGFCGNQISKDLWNKLDQHFSKESEDLRKRIKSKIEELESAKNGLSGFMVLNRDSFYPTLRADFDIAIQEWETVSQSYLNNIEKLTAELRLREQDIFKDRILPDVVDVSESLVNAIKSLNNVVLKHNEKTVTLSKDQDMARRKLRLAHIAQFVTDIDYKNTVEAISTEEARLNLMGGALKTQKEAIDGLLNEKRALEAQVKDESKGAELVNQHLTHYFGHNELKLVAEGQEPNVKFSIHRENGPANNLSEGECSLISFCYFIAKIEDELKDESENGRLIIYIDDPISSLDSNHIFFMFSLIEHVIAAPKKYGQLFISTHNMEFLKYLKNMTFPKNELKHFMIERRSSSSSFLVSAPGYMKHYITEFNYLFDQIYQCSLGDREITSNNLQYSFGNNMRKFLESYMFYKYPTYKMSFSQRLKKYFETDGVTYSLVSRIINEYSHMEDQFERGMQPIDMDEITRVSNAVINRIRTKDPDQFDALMDSINQVA